MLKQLRTKTQNQFSLAYNVIELLIKTNLHDVRKFFARNVDCPVVHELNDGLQVVEVDILQNDDRVLTRIDAEQGLKIIRTG